MKKNLGINKMFSGEIPATLDAGILAYAAIRQRQLKMRKYVRMILPAVAALFFLASGVLAILQPGEIKKQTLSHSELLAMNDWSELDQLNFNLSFELDSGITALADNSIAKGF